MNAIPPMHRLFARSGVAIGLSAILLFICVPAKVKAATSSYDPDWTRNFRVGMLSGLNVKGQIKLRGEFGVSGKNPGATGVSGVDHFYDDGYVRVDDTGNAQGYTSFWGYQSGSQYDSGTQSLLMHSSSSFTADRSATARDSIAIGFDLAYGNNLKQWGRTRLGWEFGFGWLPFGIEDNGSVGVSVNRSTFSFNTGGIVMPDAPYNGGSSGIGPTINDVATQVGNDVVPGTLRGTRSLDGNLYTFRLGPTLFYDASRYFGLAAGLGPAVGIADMSYNYNERVTFNDRSFARNQGSFGKTGVVYGGYLNVTATYHADEHGDVYLGLQYMPMSGTSLNDGKGREGTLNLSGQIYISLGVNWIF